MKFLAALLIIGIQASYAQETIVCYAERGSGFNKAEVTFNNLRDGSGNSSITVNVDNGRKLYQDARDHSGGGGFSSVNGRDFEYYGRDYCADWNYVYSGGGFFSSGKVEGISCNTKSPYITVTEITFEDTRERFIEKITVADFYSNDPLKYVVFVCK